MTERLSLYVSTYFQRESEQDIHFQEKKAKAKKGTISFSVCFTGNCYRCSTQPKQPEWHLQALSFPGNYTQLLSIKPLQLWASQVVLVVKKPPANAGDLRDVGLIPGSGRSPRGGHGNPLQYSCLENPTDRGAWWAIVHRVTKIRTRLKQLSMHCSFELCL